MSKKFLFCDVDETLISVKSMFSFHHYWFQTWLPEHQPEQGREYDDINAIMAALARRGTSRAELNRRYYEFYAGRSADEVQTCAEAWFAQSIASMPDFWIGASCEEMLRLRAQGYEPVMVSGSLTEILQPIARALDIDHILATTLACSGKRFNGRIIAPQTIGPGKAQAIAAFLERQQADAADSAAMGDDVSDIPMLEAVGLPIVIVGDPVLGAEASRRGWRTIVLNPVQAAA